MGYLNFLILILSFQSLSLIAKQYKGMPRNWFWLFENERNFYRQSAMTLCLIWFQATAQK